MPTGTSTIFGVFQAILALLDQTGTNSALPNKVVRNQKFASEIFFSKSRCIYAAMRKGIHGLLRTPAKPMMDQ
jgi:hypothetical protein